MNTSAENKTQKSMPTPKPGTAEEYKNVKNVIAVMSGKGGVRKSLVTGLLASALARKNFKVGVLDADITGPSIPMLFGLHGPVSVGEYGIQPLESRTGIKIISMNLLLPSEDQPVIWRGPLVDRFLIAAGTKDEIRRMSQNIELQTSPEKAASEGQKSDTADENEPELSEFTPIAREIIETRENLGHFEAPDISGEFRGCCGDSMQIEISMDGEIIGDAKFSTDGCSATYAVGGMLTRMIKGKTLDQARAIDSVALIEALGGLPKGHLHCAELAVKTLHQTIGADGEG